eukprot:TRINITY_DN10914_c0_g1_i2.p1 TRINITY_DN10914_c0_g1~~TRINITY_DN10914_c0_g1_i2.p1  ORF type:complete len:372 (+),score=52.61 TRINITY_DN10914_c0_g1_i2:3-1118(+)
MSSPPSPDLPLLSVYIHHWPSCPIVTRFRAYLNARDVSASTLTDVEVMQDPNARLIILSYTEDTCFTISARNRVLPHQHIPLWDRYVTLMRGCHAKAQMNDRTLLLDADLLLPYLYENTPSQIKASVFSSLLSFVSSVSPHPPLPLSILPFVLPWDRLLAPHRTAVAKGAHREADDIQEQRKRGKRVTRSRIDTFLKAKLSRHDPHRDSLAIQLEFASSVSNFYFEVKDFDSKEDMAVCQERYSTFSAGPHASCQAALVDVCLRVVDLVPSPDSVASTVFVCRESSFSSPDEPSVPPSSDEATLTQERMGRVVFLATSLLTRVAEHMVFSQYVFQNVRFFLLMRRLLQSPSPLLLVRGMSFLYASMNLFFQ